MARKASNSMSSRLTRFETIAGWLYLPFYLIILNLLLQLCLLYTSDAADE